MSLTELTVFLKIWFELFFYKTVVFLSAKKTKRNKKKKENKEKKEETYISENHNRFEIHSVRNTVRDSAVFIIISFERGLLLKESILTKVCYWVSSRLCTGLSFCANQGIFLNPS